MVGISQSSFGICPDEAAAPIIDTTGQGEACTDPDVSIPEKDVEVFMSAICIGGHVSRYR